MDMKNKATEADLKQFSDGSAFLNRELSLLEFNRRVLAQAEDPAIPLLERLRFLCIVASNLDEFFEVRVASLLAQYQMDRTLKLPDGLAATLERASAECRHLIARQYSLFNTEILPQLSDAGIRLLTLE